MCDQADDFSCERKIGGIKSRLPSVRPRPRRPSARCMTTATPYPNNQILRAAAAAEEAAAPGSNSHRAVNKCG